MLLLEGCTGVYYGFNRPHISALKVSHVRWWPEPDKQHREECEHLGQDEAEDEVEGVVVGVNGCPCEGYLRKQVKGGFKTTKARHNEMRWSESP